MNRQKFHVWALAVLLSTTGWLTAQAKPDADTAWRAVEEACKLPSVPPEWQTQKPATEEVAKFREKKMEAAGAAADKARDFYQQFPEHAQASESRKREYELVYLLVRMGDSQKLSRLEALEKDRLADPKLSEGDRFQIMSQALERKTLARRSEGMAVMLADYEKGVRELQARFPKRPEIYEMLLDVASQSEGDKAIKLAEELVAGEAPKEVRDSAQALLRKLRAVGRPLPVKFTALDGREVDLAKLKGRVVLVDFWATWCPECVAELPNVKALYEEFHAKNFDIVGISFDEQRPTLQSFVTKEKLPWAQYFDGKGWDNKYGQDYGIEKLPAMWLVDKQGNVRDLDAGKDLRAKVEKLLAEP